MPRDKGTGTVRQWFRDLFGSPYTSRYETNADVRHARGKLYPPHAHPEGRLVSMTEKEVKRFQHERETETAMDELNRQVADAKRAGKRILRTDLPVEERGE